MSQPLRDALHEAAAGVGCSLNAYALQILAAAEQLVRQHEIEDPAFFVEWARPGPMESG
jgi:hypothetical protein